MNILLLKYAGLIGVLFLQHKYLHNCLTDYYKFGIG